MHFLLFNCKQKRNPFFSIIIFMDTPHLTVKRFFLINADKFHLSSYLFLHRLTIRKRIFSLHFSTITVVSIYFTFIRSIRVLLSDLLRIPEYRVTCIFIIQSCCVYFNAKKRKFEKKFHEDSQTKSIDYFVRKSGLSEDCSIEQARDE